ncbi:MAG TPA: UDP-N-acetylglucosamine 2-epimerase (non-hydrolyzing) [Gammaproteobacteria bacterium]|nr:MAG: UDP-N-acetylglucosamine 2-epimerase [Gammaproteobacteria bacterium RIFCSPHIGHO2_12_FULL_41_20]HLB43577.1 UDP-N-acetylglucosamine 2-epimerase (non-hydrolyzing) [Gammaproteobacteria bacterium]
MRHLKIMTIVGTRPEIIKLSRVIAELEKYTHHILVHTGQNYDYELQEIFFHDLKIKKPDYFLNAANLNAAKTIGQVIIKTEEVLEKESPDAVLIYGDTNSCLSVISAKRKKIPVFHMEAGNRCFDQLVPEEINRKILDHISDINLTLSEHARRYLLAEGIRPETVFKVGSSMQEVFNYYMPEIETSNILNELDLEPYDYFVISIHREENVDSEENLLEFLTTLNKIATTYNKKIIVSTHPRTRLRLTTLQEKIIFDKRIYFLKPFGFLAYIKLQLKAFCVLSDSGSLTEDSSLLNFPAIAIRHTHERPEGMDVGTVIMSGLRIERVLQAINIVTQQHVKKTRIFSIVPDYEVNNVSQKVLRIIISYIDYVNRTVWNKQPISKYHLETNTL